MDERDRPPPRPGLPRGRRPPLPPGPYVVVGRGRAGSAAATALAAVAGASAVTVWDDGERAADGGRLPPGVELLPRGAAPDDHLRRRRPGAVVKSPGVPFDAPIVRAALERGIPVLDELELGWRLAPGPLIGITGTNGKSTTAALVRAALAAADVDAPLAGNAEAGVPLCALAGHRDPVVCEVSSFQLEGCPELVADSAVFLNLSHDHLHRHGSMAAYEAAKARLLTRPGRAASPVAIEAGGPAGRRLARACARDGARVVTFGDEPKSDYRVLSASWEVERTRVEISSPSGRRRLEARLPGAHNARNLAAAMALADALGLDPAATDAALCREPGVPGRFERIDEGQDFDVIVDFAHNPAGVEVALGTARAIARRRPGARLRAVVSASGGHDRHKRPPMAAAARRLADDLVLTEDNWRGEPRSGPLRDLLAGTRGVRGGRVSVVPAREEAIATVLRRAQAGDVVLIAGRGAMPRLIRDIAGNGPAFDDRAVARAALRELR
ncbi:MAG: Mur ligase family protein [Solirubrobacteraceae bacterium]